MPHTEATTPLPDPLAAAQPTALPTRRRGRPRRDQTLSPVEHITLATLLAKQCSLAQIAHALGKPPAVLRQHVAAAQDLLHAATPRAAATWIRAMDVAAEKGDHKPARDLLIATKAIDPQNDPTTTTPIHVHIGFVIPGLGPAGQQSATPHVLDTRPVLDRPAHTP